MRKKLMSLVFVMSVGVVPSISFSDASGPDFFRVIDVAANDVLNIRDRASASAQKVGEIPPNTDGIINLGCSGGLTFAEWEEATPEEREASKKQRWCQIDYLGTVGWAAARYLAEGSAPEGETEEPGFAWRLVSVGEEVAVGEGQIVFTPDGSVSGTTGCNSFQGGAMAGRGILEFQQPMAMTRMACPDELQRQEDAMLQTMSGAVRMTYDPLIDQLLLEPVGEAPKLRFQRIR